MKFEVQDHTGQTIATHEVKTPEQRLYTITWKTGDRSMYLRFEGDRTIGSLADEIRLADEYLGLATAIDMAVAALESVRSVGVERCGHCGGTRPCRC